MVLGLSTRVVIAATASALTFVSVYLVLRSQREEQQQEDEQELARKQSAQRQDSTSSLVDAASAEKQREEEEAKILRQSRQGRRSSFSPLDKCLTTLQKMAHGARNEREKEDILYVMRVIVGPELEPSPIERDSRLKENTKQWILQEFSRTSHQDSQVDTQMPPPSNRQPEFSRVQSAMVLKKGEVQTILMDVDSFTTFDIWALDTASGGHALQTLGWFLLHRWGCVSRYNIDAKRLEVWLQRVEELYKAHNNPYHNATHAADVLQALHSFLVMGMRRYFTDLEVFALLLAAIIHDVDHDGRTNGYHENILSERALRYNGVSVQENHHIATAMTLLQNKECNILQGLSQSQFKEIRKIIIDSVLATDMHDHFHHVKTLKLEVESRGIDSKEWSFNDRQILRSLVLHLADLSNPLRPVPLCEKWAKLVLQEMFAQGDSEKSLQLPVSALCDRTTTELANSQIGFLQYIVKPFVEAMVSVLPELNQQVTLIMNENIAFWEARKASPAMERRPQNSDDPNNSSNGDQSTGSGE